MIIHDCKKCFDDSLRGQDNWLGKITFEGDDLASRLLEKYCQTDVNNQEILEILHFFNKRIIQVDVESHTYKLLFEEKIITLDFSKMGSGEKVFVACYLASELGEKVVVSDGISSLTQDKLQRFVDTYRDNEYIEVAPPTQTIEYAFKRLMGRV